MTRDHNLVLMNPHLPWPDDLRDEAHDAYDANLRNAAHPAPRAEGWRSGIGTPKHDDGDGGMVVVALMVCALAGFSVGFLLGTLAQWVWM